MTFKIIQQVEEEISGLEGVTLSLERESDGKTIEVHIPDKVWLGVKVDDFCEVWGLNFVSSGHYPR